MASIMLILGFITAAGIIYVAILQRQMMEDQRAQIAAQQEIIRELHQVLEKVGGSQS
jgi:N-methylhydantoinase B/oxoprolinase/acetone carboxylase alpha subunit